VRALARTLANIPATPKLPTAFPGFSPASVPAMGSEQRRVSCPGLGGCTSTRLAGTDYSGFHFTWR